MNRSPVLLTGPPGAGKGTQARIFASRHGWYTFSIGQLLRDTADPEIRSIMDAGDLLPTEHVTRLVIEEIEQHTEPVIVDGFPRRLDQSREFDRRAGEHGIKDYVVVLLDVDTETSWQRIKDRGRKDDEYTAWQHRWQEYYEHTEPAIEYCRQHNTLTEIDGTDSIEDVTRAMESALNAA